MANYLFEQMTQEQAVAYDGSVDDLFFLTGSASELQATFNPKVGLSVATITLTMGAVSHTFVAEALANDQFTFFGDPDDESTVAFGSNDTANGDFYGITGSEGFGARYYAFAGDDTVIGSEANDTIWGGAGNDILSGNQNTDATDTDYYNGGAGADTIFGTDASDHIWGNESTSTAGASDGADSIFGGDGNDYVNGMVGADTILGGDGNDRLYGGADADSIDGGLGWDYLQGNKGNDSLFGNDGNDTIRGGANNDTLDGGADNDVLMGDAGNDRLIGGDDYDTMTGGTGVDTFAFDTGEANTTDVADGLFDTITDFTIDTDLIDLSNGVPTDVLYADEGFTFGTVVQALGYAQDSLIDGTTDSVAAIQVGSDTFLFFDSTGGDTIDSVIKLSGITADDVDTDQFV